MRKSKGSGKMMMAFGSLLTVAALCLTGYNLWGEYQATKNANEALLQVEQVILAGDAEEESDHVEKASENNAENLDAEQDSENDSNGGMTVRMADGVDYIGIIEIPSLSLKLPIINEWDDAKLKIAPCRYFGSAYDGDLIISGHSYKNHFRYIRNLTAGEPVIFTDFEGTRFVYEVVSYEVIGGSDVEGMLCGEWDLSLFTCTYNGSARHTVRCKLVPEENEWMAEIQIPESTYKGAEIGWTGMERVITETTDISGLSGNLGNEEELETAESGEEPEAAMEEPSSASVDDEDEAIDQDADLINDLETVSE